MLPVLLLVAVSIRNHGLLDTSRGDVLAFVQSEWDSVGTVLDAGAGTDEYHFADAGKRLQRRTLDRLLFVGDTFVANYNRKPYFKVGTGAGSSSSSIASHLWT